MNPLRSRPAFLQFLASAAVAASALPAMNSAMLADELRTSANTDVRETVLSPPASMPIGGAADGRPAVKSAVPNPSTHPSTRTSTPKPPANQGRSILFISGSQAAPQNGELPQNSATNPVDSSGISATERFMQALAEHRKGDEVSDERLSPSAADTAESPIPDTGSHSSLQEKGASAEPESIVDEDPVERAKAARFLKLKSQLQQLTSNFEASRKNAGTPDHVPSASSGSHAPAPAGGLPVPGSTEHQRQGHASSEQPRHQGNPADANHPKEAVGPSDSPRPSASNDEGSVKNDHPSTKDDHTPQTEHAPGTPNQANAKHHSEATHELTSPLAQQVVVDGTIDRLGLANNLYAVGDYVLAMEMYEQADPVEMSAQQQIWTEYQIANCLRRMGKKAEASGRYRRLAGQPEAGWLSGQSRWWVDVLEQTRQLEKSLADEESSASTTAQATESHHSSHSQANSKESKHGKPAH